MKLQRGIVRLVLGAGLALAATMAHAETYPARTVRILVPYAPGGVPDLVARSIAPHLSEAMGQQFIVENKPGAGGITAAQEVIRSDADGYTLLLSDIQQLAINPFLFSKLPYDPAKDFEPVSFAATIPLYLVAQPGLKVGSLADLVKAAKAKPGELTYGSSGIGSIHHITMEVLKSALGIDVVHVPYKGAGQSVPAFMAGEVSLLISAYPSMQQQVQSGKAKLVAVTTLKRADQTPNVPAVSETVKDFDFSSEMGFVVKAGTPPEIVNRLSTEISKGLKQAEMVQRLVKAGLVLFGTTSQAYGQNIVRNLEKFEKAVKLSRAKTE